jgi:hypothetical protein
VSDKLSPAMAELLAAADNLENEVYRHFQGIESADIKRRLLRSALDRYQRARTKVTLSGAAATEITVPR